jgi:hypothetical protein
VWNESATWLPKGLTQVKLINNLLNGYVFGRDNILVMLDDGLSLGQTERQRESILVYPNPAQRYITFMTPSIGGRLEIYDASGVLVLSSEMVFPATLPVDHLKKGIYIYRIVGDNHNFTGKFFKN